MLVQVKSKESANELQNYCNKNIGEVKELHYYENEKSRTFQNFFVVEFDDVSAVGRAMFEVAGFGETPNYSIPISSPFMWFASDRLSNVQYQAEDKSQITTVSHKIVSSTAVKQHLESQAIEQKEALQSKNNLNHYLLRYRDLDEQMRAYHDLTKISEVGTRLRFLACEQIELALTGMFPNVEVLPFGSSVNSYGKSNSDLDMCLKLIKESKNKDTSSTRLLFHTKGTPSGQGSRYQIQKYCDQIASLIKSFLPGIQDVQHILHARVPIIKYHQELIGLECDVSFATSGYHMSELLYLYGELDNRVRPLVFAIRNWAKEQQLVQDMRPTVFFTNFEITLMVIFFLQSEYGMLPSLNKLRELADLSVDEYVCNDGVNCTFIRDITGLQPDLNRHWTFQPIINGDTRYSSPTVPLDSEKPLCLKQMLRDFYAFYAAFDYGKNAICIRQGKTVPREHVELQLKKRFHYSLVIINPLEPDLNVAANIQKRALNNLIKACKNSLYKLEELDSPSNSKLLASDAISELTHIFEPSQLSLPLSHFINSNISTTTEENNDLKSSHLRQSLKEVINSDLFPNDEVNKHKDRSEIIPDELNESVHQTPQSRKKKKLKKNIQNIANSVINHDLGKQITDVLTEAPEESKEYTKDRIEVLQNKRSRLKVKHNFRKEALPKVNQSINVDVKTFFRK